MLEGISESLRNNKSLLIEELSQRSGQVNEAMTTAFQKTIFKSLQNWLEAHPIIAWLIDHPLWILGIFLVFLLIFSGFFRVIGRLSEEAWLMVLRFPLQLARLLMKLFYQSSKTHNFKKVKANSENEKQEKLISILLRLEEIKQEQEELLKEMKSILNSPDTHKIKSTAKV